jgi:hypothetical protein
MLRSLATRNSLLGAPSRHVLCELQRVRRIFTLVPSQLQTRDLVSLEAKPIKSIVIHQAITCEGDKEVERVAQIGRVQLHMLKAHSYHGVSTYQKPLFPKALGFLYYDPGPVFAPIAGEVRFRIVHSGLPGDFEHGHDLMAEGRPVPWRIPLAGVLRNKTHRPLATLITATSDAAAQFCGLGDSDLNLPPTDPDAIVLHSLRQPFWVNIPGPCAGVHRS